MDSKVKLKLKFYVNIGALKEDNCYCNYHGPKCNKYVDGSCIVKTKILIVRYMEELDRREYRKERERHI